MLASGQPPEQQESVRRIVLVVLASAISLLFLWMIRDFLMSLLLAAIMAGGVRPVYRKLLLHAGGRRAVSAGLTLTLTSLLVIVPLLLLTAVAAEQAVELGRAAEPWVREKVATAGAFDELAESYPELALLKPYRDDLLKKAGEVASSLGSYAVGVLTSAAEQLFKVVLLLFVMLYAAFYFLIDGPVILQRILFYSPLPSEDEARMVGRFLSVARATIKGTLVIGAIQGLLGGIGFFVSGVPGAALWATVMGVLSVIPGLGPVIVWLPAVFYLFIDARTGPAVGLFLFCALVVGSVDNFLRPWLVGKDTKLPDLLILVATLGGIFLFGAVGFIIGPIIAALFVTVWDIYGEVFRGVLPDAPPLSHPPPPPTPVLAVAASRGEAPPERAQPSSPLGEAPPADPERSKPAPEE